jgi:hypothetical protein
MTKNADVSKSVETRLSEDIPTLEAEIAELTQELERVITSTRELLNAEDPAKGIYHNTEIHELKQEKLRIGVDIKFRSNKINRINLGIDGMGSELPEDGFAF